MIKLLKNRKGFAMAELLAVSIVLLFIFSVLFSNYLPLVAEYETRLSYNDVTAQYAAHYIRKMYKEALEDSNQGKGLEQLLTKGINDDGFHTVYNTNPEQKNTAIYDEILSKDKVDCKKIIDGYEIEEIIITKYKLKDGNEKGYVKTSYTKDSGSLYSYINYLPNYEKSIYTEKDESGGAQLYRIILKTKNYGYATTPILSDYKTPNECFVFATNGNGLKITKYLYNEKNGCGTTVTIPRTGKGNGISGRITEIGNGAFSKKENDSTDLGYNVKEVILTNQIRRIGNNAFKGSNLEKIPSLLNNVENIGAYAFANTKITEVDLSDFPASSYTIGDYAFSENKNLSNVELPKNNIYSDINNNNKVLTKGLFAKSGTETDGINVTIPGEMTTVGEEMFYLAKIKGITLNKGVQTIGTSAFAQTDNDGNVIGNSSIENLEFQSTVEKIGERSFDGLGIGNINFNSSGVNLLIGNYAFRNEAKNNSTIKEETRNNTITIPSRVTEIGRGAFDNLKCTDKECVEGKIKELIFEDGSKLTTIDADAFRANNIRAVEIPNSVNKIGEKAFSRNSNLTNVTLPQNNSNYSTISKELFYGCGNLESITIPNSVNSINESAFYVASAVSGNKLKEVIIDVEKSELQRISSHAFYGQENLEEFKIPAKVDIIQADAFGECNKLTKIENYSSNVDFTKRGCPVFYSTTTCDITSEGNNIYLKYQDKAQKTITYMGGATNNE